METITLLNSRCQNRIVGKKSTIALVEYLILFLLLELEATQEMCSQYYGTPNIMSKCIQNS